MRKMRKFLTVDFVRQLVYDELEEMGSLPVHQLIKNIESDLRVALKDDTFVIRSDFFIASLIYKNSPFMIKGNNISIYRKRRNLLYTGGTK